MSFYSNKALCYSILISLAIAATEAPVWISLFAFFILLWKWLTEKYHWAPLSRTWTSILSVVLFCLIYIQYRNFFGKEESAALFVGLVALKIMDYHTQRDHQFLILLGFFLVLLKTIFTLDLVWMPPTLIAYLGLWLSLVDTKALHPLDVIKKIVPRSLPLTLVLFLAFPRIVVPWSQQNSPAHAEMGFSDQLSPGQFSSLVESNQLAFRVQFEPSLELTQSDLYWRGAVLTHSEGLRWTPAPTRSLSPREAPPKTGGGDIRYQVMLEPLSLGYLFLLDHPQRVNSSDLQFSELQSSVYRLHQVPRQTTPYSAISSFSQNGTDNPSSEERLQLPELPPKTAAWVKSVQARTKTAQERLSELIGFFRKNSFVYTLNPGAYAKEDLDLFLFEKRQGFCEHYATAMATLARALGLPSRVVSGYQGGAYNPYGKFWRISQKDAHAWVELWVNDHWQRFDPTGWIAPLRLEISAEEFFALTPEQQRQYGRSSEWKHNSGTWAFFDQLTLGFESLNYRWNTFLIGFDLESQRQFLDHVQSHWTWFLYAGLLIVLSLWTLQRWQRKNKPSLLHPSSDLISYIERWGNHSNLRRLHAETPLQYLSRLAVRRPDLQRYLMLLASEYERTMYRSEPLSPEFQGLKRKIKRQLRARVR